MRSIPDISSALLHCRSLCPSEEAEILQQQRHELAGYSWQDGTWNAKEHNYCGVFLSNRSRVLVDEEHPAFTWKQTLSSWTMHETEMIEAHDSKQTHKVYLTQIIFPMFYQTVMGRLYNWHAASLGFTKPSRATGWNYKQNLPTLKRKLLSYAALKGRNTSLS